MSAAKIAQHTGALKAFSNLYVYKVMEYTRSDMLQRVEPYRPKPEQHRDSSRKKEVKEFSAAEVDALMSCHDTSALLGIRDRALPHSCWPPACALRPQLSYRTRTTTRWLG